MFVAVHLSLQHTWWELSVCLKKVRTIPMFVWSILGLCIGICLLPFISFLANLNCLFCDDTDNFGDTVFFILCFFSKSWLFPLYFPADALESLRQSCEFVCPNDGFLEQVIKGNAISSFDFWDSIASLHHVHVMDSKCLLFLFSCGS